MKILFTGMLSAHCKKPTEVANKTFYTAFSLAFADTHADYEIDWKIPSLSWDKEFLSQYDLIFIGLVPPTSMSANRVYGALKCLDTVFDWPNVRIILDSPQLWQFTPGFSAISKDPTYLISSFYEKRPSYREADTYKNLTSFKSVCEKFLTQTWPKTIYPSLPWHSGDRLESHLPNAKNSLGVNLDSYFLSKYDSDFGQSTRSGWAVDNHKSKWAQKLQKTVSEWFTELKLGKKFNDDDAYSLIKSSIGVVIPPVERGVGTWWTYRYVQALLSGTPVATEWVESQKLGYQWSALPYQIEEMSDQERLNLARNQLEAYKSHIPDLESLKNIFTVVLKNEGEKIA